MQLERWDDLETDVSDYLWLLLGSGVDNIVSSADDAGSVRQHKMELQLGKYTVVGVADVINGDILADWKCTSCWSYLHGIKDEWVEQLNVYDYLYEVERKRASGNSELALKYYSTLVPIRHLKIYAILRDWQKSKAVDPDYPKIPFSISHVPQWTHEQQEAYIQARLKDHNENSHRCCTGEERWERPTTYAIKKKGQKRAMRVLNSSEEAEEYMNKKGGDFVEVRKGKNVRCEDYCNIRSVCPYV